MKTRDGRLGCEAAGGAALPPRVFLHGSGGAARAWRGQLDFFGDRFHAVAWDMPGYGGSAPLANCSIAALADVLQDFLQQVGATKPILVGHSIGGVAGKPFGAEKPHTGHPGAHAQNRPAVGEAHDDWHKAVIAARPEALRLAD